MVVTPKSEMISIHCPANRHPQSLSFKDDIVVFASYNKIVLYNILDGRVLAVLDNGLHTDVVNCVTSCDLGIISGCNDGTARLWVNQIGGLDFTSSLVMEHGFPVHAVGVFENTLVTADSSGFVKVWKYDGNTVENLQTIKLKCIPLSLAVTKMFGSVILAIGCTDKTVKIYTQNIGSGEFDYSASLKGHFDWIRSLSFQKYGLASASQDKCIRIWKFAKYCIVKPDISTNITCIKTMEEEKVQIFLDAVLVGHEDMVYTVHFSSTERILSASADKTVLLWEVEPETNTWCIKATIGSSVGSYHGVYSAILCGNVIIANTGSLNIWKSDDNEFKWNPYQIFGGHMSSVNQVKFDGNGLVYSVSEDMTCRVFGPDHNGKWNELARPQIHGHPIKTLEFASENRLISGSDEKVIRVFESPRMVLESFENICGFHIDIKTVSSPATVPALGLSNKISESHKDLKTFVKPPFEAELIETLYPEIEKLYGHESSIFTLCRNGNYLFSSCVGKGKVIVWSLESYDAIQELRDHTHTVSSIACSGEKLVTVSRDRSMCIYKKGENGLFCLEKLIPKAHARIIWGVSFSNDGNIIFTGSRDKMMKIWSATGTLLGSLEFEDSITSISVLPQLFHHGHVIGIGLECGKVHIYYYDVTIKQILSDKSLDHFGRVNSIDWFLNGTNYLLVTGGEDCAVKISQIYL